MTTRTILQNPSTGRFDCPACGRMMTGEPEENNPAVEHHECDCGYRVGARLDGAGRIIGMWRE